MYQLIWIIDTIEITLNRPVDNKTHLRADIRSMWAPLSLQGEHFTTTIFWIPVESSSQVSLRITENLLAIILIPITIWTEEFANPFVTLKTYRMLVKRENQNLDDLLDYMEKNLGRFHEVSHINVLHALVDLNDIWTWHQVPLAASCYEKSFGDHGNRMERNIWPNCHNSPQFEATATWNLENSH